MKGGKFTVLLIASLVMLLAAAFPVSAAESAEFTVETNTTAVRGGEFSIDISAGRNPGFAELQLDLTYNQKYLTLVGVEASSRLEGVGAKVTFPSSVSKYPYTIKVKSDENITGNYVLFTATFKLSSSATLGNYDVSVNCSKGHMKDKNGNTINVSAKSGGVSIECEHKFDHKIGEVEPTCENRGETIYKCTECQAVMTVYTEALGHSWKKVSQKSPTCTEAGKIVTRCTKCSKEETITDGDPLGHDYDSGTVVPSTCSKEGYTLHKCKRCKEEYRDNYTELSDHTYKESIVEEPTCFREGYKRLTCTECGDTHTEKMAKVDHRYSPTVSKEATHNERGWTAYECDFCGETKKDDYTDIIPYDLEYVIVTEPTCTTDGLGRWVCRDGCGYSNDQIIKATDHSYSEWHTEVNPTFDKSGLRVHVCKLCGHEESEEIAPLGNQGTVNSGVLTPSQKVSAILIATIVAITVVLVLVIFMHGIRGPGKRRRATGRR